MAAATIKATVIQSFAKFLLGSDTFNRVKAVVLRQEDKDLSGKQKQIAAYEEVKMIGMGIAAWAINLAIELAVAYLRTLAGGEKPNDK